MRCVPMSPYMAVNAQGMSLHLAKRDEQNGAISPTQIIFLEKLCYLTESLLIENIRSSSKVNDFI